MIENSKMNVKKFFFRCVIDNNLFVTGQHCLYHYLDLKDVNSFICNEVIIDLIVLSTKVSSFMYILNFLLYAF